MKKPVVDYREFRLSRLNEARFRHVKLLGGWIVYFILYFVTENLIPLENCHVIHCRLDDLIPFNEYFLIFYCSWYLLIFGTLLYTILYDIPRFRKVQVFIMITQAVAMFVYIVYPNRQDLRPTSFEHENFLTAAMAFIYSFDTSSGVCPSLHVAYSLGVLSVGLKHPKLKAYLKLLLLVWVVLICMSVCFVKQHSAVDVFWGLLLSLFTECVVYGRDYWLPRLRRSR
ncbi:MAG: hypothetical protein K6C08_14610 [Oscillospiraceae bacterium]|nr:hypothetical protein [Oscillospiraceae bacterium]